MTASVIIALIAAFPPTLGAILAFASARSVKRSVATNGSLPIGALVERLEGKLDRIEADVHRMGERVAHLEGVHAIHPLGS